MTVVSLPVFSKTRAYAAFISCMFLYCVADEVFKPRENKISGPKQAVTGMDEIPA